MASTYPTSLDVFTNPLAADLMTSPSHAQQHSDLNDAVEALEAKVAIGNTVLGTYTSFTPSFAAGLTVGNGVGSGSYCRVNNFVHVQATFTLGTTSSVTGIIQPSLPVNINASMLTSGAMYGVTNYSDASAGFTYFGRPMYNGNANSFFLMCFGTAATYANSAYTNITVPMTWAVSDIIQWNLYYRAA